MATVQAAGRREAEWRRKVEGLGLAHTSPSGATTLPSCRACRIPTTSTSTSSPSLSLAPATALATCPSRSVTGEARKPTTVQSSATLPLTGPADTATHRPGGDRLGSWGGWMVLENSSA